MFSDTVLTPAPILDKQWRHDSGHSGASDTDNWSHGAAVLQVIFSASDRCVKC